MRPHGIRRLGEHTRKTPRLAKIEMAYSRGCPTSLCFEEGRTISTMMHLQDAEREEGETRNVAAKRITLNRGVECFKNVFRATTRSSSPLWTLPATFSQRTITGKSAALDTLSCPAQMHRWTRSRTCHTQTAKTTISPNRSGKRACRNCSSLPSSCSCHGWASF